MSDRVSAEQRSRNMARVRNKNTAPEMIVRKTLHRLGYRFRLHRRDLPGSPDIVLPRHHTAVFVHGCFWHGHPGCARAARPQTNEAFWNAKLDKNVRRDKEAQEKLSSQGWRVLVIWQCQTKNPADLEVLIHRFFSTGLEESYGGKEWSESQDTQIL